MKQITWIVSGVNIPNVGKAEIDKTIKVDKHIAENLVDQGFAKYTRAKKTEVKEEVKEDSKKKDTKKGGNE